MKEYSLEYIAYNNLCYDVGYLNGDHLKFNKTTFLSSLLCITGCNLATSLNNFKDDWVTFGIKAIPAFVMLKETYRMSKDIKERTESTYYLQILCENLEKKGIHINLEDMKNAVFSDDNLLCSIRLNDEMQLSINNDIINYVDSKKQIDITDEVAECCLGEKDLKEYKKNKMTK